MARDPQARHANLLASPDTQSQSLSMAYRESSSRCGRCASSFGCVSAGISVDDIGACLLLPTDRAADERCLLRTNTFGLSFAGNAYT